MYADYLRLSWVNTSMVGLSQLKAILDYTLPALCTPVNPFPADPISSERGSDGMIPCNNNNNRHIYKAP